MMTNRDENGEKKWTMNFGYWNCAKGFGGKLDILLELMQTNDLRILFVSESDITENMKLSLFNMPGYQLENSLTLKKFKKCRISAFVDTSINAIRRCDLEMDGNEVIVYEVREINTLVCGLYRPFKINEDEPENLVDKFDKLIQNLEMLNNEGKKVVVMGDFNVNYLEIGNTSYRLNGLMNKLSNWANEFNMVQLVQNPTRRRHVQLETHTRMEEALLDHVYSNSSTSIEEIQHVSNFASDHDALICKVESAQKKKKIEKTSVRFRDWSKYTKEKLQERLSSSNWDENTNKTAQIVCNNLDQKIITILDKIAPMRTCRIRKPEQFVCPKIERWKRLRKKAFEKFKSTKNEQFLLNCKELTKKIKRASKDEKKKLVRGGRDGIKNSKDLWGAVSKAKGFYFEPLPNIQYKEKIACSDQEKADMISTFFQEKLEECELRTKKDLQVDHGPNVSELNAYKDEQIVFSEEEVHEVLLNLKRKKCSGFDNIPMIVYRDGADQLKSVTTKLLNSVLRERKVPEQWRVGRILPLHKKGKKNEASNYRPISNLCSMGKIYEKCIKKYIQMLEQKCGIDLTGDHQHGFKKCRSTSTAGLSVQAYIGEKLDEGDMVLLVSCDLTAAFDLLDKDILEKRMEEKGIPNHLLQIIIDWITDRIGFVEVNGQRSMFFDIKLGCVQGSVLGPFIFALFMSPLGCLNFGKVFSYADDTYNGFSGKDYHQVAQDAEQKLEALYQWLTRSGMVVNLDKTECCLFSRTDVQTRDLMVNDQKIKVDRKIRVLGVTFDTRLTWEVQVEEACAKAKRNLHGLRHISRYFNSTELSKIATACVFASLYYGCEIWLGPQTRRKSILKLNAVSTNCLRICKKDWRKAFNRDQLHQEFKRATPIEMGDYCLARTLRNILLRENPMDLFVGILDNILEERREPERVFLTKKNRRRVGLNVLSHRLTDVSRRMKFNWLNNELSDDLVRVKLKECFHCSTHW